MQSTIRPWIWSIAILFAPQAVALGLGGIDVDSHLGEPLRARIALLELTETDAASLEVQLASAEEYKRIGLHYPQGIAPGFRVVNEQGAAPFILISTPHHLKEPFLDLLITVSSSGGRISRAYTFLLDLSADPGAPRLLVIPEAEAQQTIRSQADISPEAGADDSHQPVGAGGASVGKHAIGRKVENRQRTSPSFDRGHITLAENDARMPDGRGMAGRHDRAQETRRFGELALALSVSLSISRSDPGSQSSREELADALQDELIAKEKTVAELNEQVAEMQTVIRMLQGRLGIRADSGVADTATGDIRGSAAIGAVSAKPGITVTATPVVPVEAESRGLWQQALFILVLLSLGAGGYFGYRRYRAARGWKQKTADDTDDIRRLSGTTELSREEADSVGEGASIVQPPKVLDMTLPFGDQSMKVPAVAQQVESILPPEYELLEEADIYLRFGHDKLAEEVLREAIKINPKNPQAYLTLLRVYESREDRLAFLSVAQHLKSLGDDNAWKKALEMGREFDPDNDFYH
ncbi:MAG: hypothetical protein IPM27_03435 [Nitrosomonadales bacterium]|nr:hypothetical protein [Nitrosomonadales bacterium]